MSVPLTPSSPLTLKGCSGSLLLFWSDKGLGECYFLTLFFVEEPSTPGILPQFLLLLYLCPGSSLFSHTLTVTPFTVPEDAQMHLLQHLTNLMLV